MELYSVIQDGRLVLCMAIGPPNINTGRFLVYDPDHKAKKSLTEWGGFYAARAGMRFYTFLTKNL